MPDASETLNQITDIIVNRYEAGYAYSKQELRQNLDAIVEVMDAHSHACVGTRKQTGRAE